MIHPISLLPISPSESHAAFLFPEVTVQNQGRSFRKTKFQNYLSTRVSWVQSENTHIKDLSSISFQDLLIIYSQAFFQVLSYSLSYLILTTALDRCY